MFRLISISGFARSGKDTLAEAINQTVGECKKLSFAYQLKVDLNNLLKSSFGISAFTEDDKEKKIVRPILMAYGQAARQIDPNFWIKKVAKSINEYKNYTFAEISAANTYVTISDQRFANEYLWSKSMGGKTIWVERTGYGPANEDEVKYTAPLKNIADYQILWDDLGENTIQKALPFAKTALEYLYGNF